MRDKKIWVFNAGTAFGGNPKWLFLYIVNYRKDITPYWFCYNRKQVQYIRKLGYKAYLFKSKRAEKIGAKAGVYVVDQNKEVFQSYLHGSTILNLWHGVGCKTVEKNVDTGFMREGIVKKNIRNKEYYKKYQLFLVTSPLMEKHFMEQCDVDADKVIRAGYPCCVYPDPVSTFDHDILARKGLPRDTKIAVYAPTYRDYAPTDFFSAAVPDMHKLIRALEENHFLLILKIHPKMKKDFQYQNFKKMYEGDPHLLFWDNANDFYEVMDQIELAIVDYSSIFYDLLAKGVKYFVRYIFDYDRKESVRDFAFDYKEMSCGKICSSFEELLHVFSDYKEDDERELQRIYDLFWSYSDEKTFETIVERALSFEPDKDHQLPTLYSFDVFDTLIGRSTLLPSGVFRYVQDKMIASGLEYPGYVKRSFYEIRPQAESNCREYYRKSQLLRQTDRIEISLDMIYDRIQELYGLSDTQTRQLKEWELECEYAASIPYEENIARVKELVAQGETVVLISDMYLPKEFVRKLLCKADPVLAELPLYLSSEVGVQKTTKKLFFEVFHQVDYRFGKWIHYGDNPKADGKVPQSLGIETVNHSIPEPDHYEEALNNFINTYDGYQVSALFSRFRSKGHTQEEVFAYCYASLYLVPYVNWAIRHAIEHGTECLYFISRDGYYLKLIADKIIETKGLSIKTKYIYGSRKAWRIPSQIYQIDREFFSEFGNFAGITSYDQLLEAADITEKEFLEIFPELAFLKGQGRIAGKQLKLIRKTLGNSEKYRACLLEKAREEREIVLRYLRQEIDLSERYAFVEFWGRGYTQDCLANLLWEASQMENEVVFYYARSIYPSQGRAIRYNFSSNDHSYIFIEALFANMPYQSIREYTEKDGAVVPVITERRDRASLQQALEKYLPAFAADFSSAAFTDEETIERCLFDFGVSYYHQFQEEDIFIQTLAGLNYSEAICGREQEFAPKITLKSIIRNLKGDRFRTRSKAMSIKRSNKCYQWIYAFYQNALDEENGWYSLLRKLRKVLKRVLK